MSLCVFDKGWDRLLILLLAGILQSTWAATQELPDALSAVMGKSFYALGDSTTSADPPQSSAAASPDSSCGKFLTRWVERGLRDQADIYTSPLHRFEMKWVIGLPVVTAGLIAIDKHASGAPPRNPSSASADISDVGLFATAGAVGVLLIDGTTQRDSHASKPARFEPRRWQTVASCMPCCSSLRSANVLYKERVRGISFRPRAWIIHFPPAIRSSRGQLPVELRTNTKPWVEWLAHGTAAAVSVTRFTSLQHFPSDVVVGKHTWVLDRTPYLSCSLQGWSQCGMQSEIVQENTVSISRKREVTDVEE